MTKVIVLGEENWKPTGQKKIEFVHSIDANEDKPGNSNRAINKPDVWHNVELVSLGGRGHLDMMFAYDNDRRTDGVLYLGHFNDGIV